MCVLSWLLTALLAAALVSPAAAVVVGPSAGGAPDGPVVASGGRTVPVGPGGAVAGRRAVARVAAGPAVLPAGPVEGVARAGAFRWPLDGTPRVVRRFDPPPSPWLPGHRGVDLAAPVGAAVLAAGAGVVHFAGVVAGRGVVSVAHSGGLRTTYEPVAVAVRAGDPVRPGDPIGVLTAGHVGCPDRSCLHWGLRRGETYLDPLALLGQTRVRLLPIAPVDHD